MKTFETSLMSSEANHKLITSGVSRGFAFANKTYAAALAAIA